MKPVPFSGRGYIAFMTAPWVFVQMICNTCPQWVSVYVSNQRQQITVSIHDNRFEPATKQLSVKAVGSVEALRIDAVDMPHASREVPFRSMDEQMVMIGHQAISAYPDIPQFGCVLEQINERQIIVMAFKNPIRPPPSIHHMIPGALILYP